MRLLASASLAPSLVLALVACGSSPAPRVEEPSAPAPAPASSAAPETKKTEPARADDDASLRASFDDACKKADAEACGKFALMAARGIGGARDDLAATDAAKKGCAADSGLACTLLGLFFRDGRGTAQDSDKAKAAFRHACDLKNADGCRGAREMEEEAAPAPAAKAASGSSLRASGMTVDGTSFSSMECDLGGGGGLLGPIAIAKGVSLQRAALDACVKKPTETTVKVTSANGAFTKVEATGGDAKVNRCVEKALRGKQAAIPGTCTMTVAHGR